MQKLFFIILLVFLMGCSSHIDKKPTKQIPHLDKKYLEKLDFSKNELQSIKINKSWFYVLKNGKYIETITNKQGKADIFKEGVARTRVNGKIGFFNKSLDIVLAPLYDYAFPFYDGVSEICMGCKEHGEEDNRMIEGGVWKSIDRKGLIIEE